MTTIRTVVELSHLVAEQPSEFGAKATRLAELLVAGLPVPNGFGIGAGAYRAFVAGRRVGETSLEHLLLDLEHRLDKGIAEERLRDRLTTIRAAILTGRLSSGLLDEVKSAIRRLPADTRFAVRSSSDLEDSGAASFAGQLDTTLGVPAAEVPKAIQQCWASLWSERAVHYRAEHGLPVAGARMAVLVLEMIDCEAAGVAFSVDPISGADEVVVEAVWGLGEGLAQGSLDPDRYTVDKRSFTERQPAVIACKRQRVVATGAGGTHVESVPEDRWSVRCLDTAQLADLTRLVVSLEARAGQPQDVEWGLSGGRIHLFQTRPITALARQSIYTESDEAGDTLWTGAFLEERFPEPLSPLGWSVIRESFERIALRDPLSFLGIQTRDLPQLTRLYQGHPYVPVEVFRRLYKLFPEPLLPEDTARYFLDGDTRSRKSAASPRSLGDPRLILSVVTAIAADPANWSPFGNHAVWARFVPRYDATIVTIESELATARATRAELPVLLTMAGVIEHASSRLLRIHRWSLTHADMLYSLLRRVGRVWLGDRADSISSDLVSHLRDRSLEMDDRLRHLAALAGQTPGAPAALRDAESVEGLRATLDATEGTRRLVREIELFLGTHGHRSYSLDIWQPGFAAEPKQLFQMLGALNASGAPRDQSSRRSGARREARRRIFRSPIDAPRWAAYSALVKLTCRYVRLREDQRFHWQKGLALLRATYLEVGRRLVERGRLADAEDVFFVLRREIEQLASGEAALPDLARLATRRRAEHELLRADYARDTLSSYPRFLRGSRSVSTMTDNRRDDQLTGSPVSPGRASGPVIVVHSPADLPTIVAGSVLVTRGADPGWTPMFGKIVALVMESGGQLSHGSVVAREYGIPAVVGVSGAMTRLVDGEIVIVDGEAGTVTRVARQAIG